MIKLVEWSTDWAGNEQLKGKKIVFLDKFSAARGAWDGFMFDIQGLRLSKVEKELGLSPNKNHITVYFLKWYFSYDKEGYKSAMRNVTITNERVLI